MFEILTVCTGNICRSPLAAQLLAARLAPFSPVVGSAGTRGLPAAGMTPEAALIATELGIPPEVSGAHRSRFLTEQLLDSPDLILTMTREHRHAVAELAPSRLRATFTIREFARISHAIPDDELRRAADAAGADASARVRAVASLVATHRGLVAPPPTRDDDDVVDPYGRSRQTYLLSASQLAPAVAATAEIVAIALGGALDGRSGAAVGE